MSKTLAIEIVDNNGNWQEHTTRCMGAKIKHGMTNNHSALANASTCDLTMRNTDKHFSPDAGYTSTLELRRRARVRYSKDSDGYCLRVTRAGIGGGGGTNIINATGTNPYIAFDQGVGTRSRNAWLQFFEVDNPGYLTTIAVTSLFNNGGVTVRIFAVDVSNPDAWKVTGSVLDEKTNASFPPGTVTFNMAGTAFLERYTKYAALFYGADITSGVDMAGIATDVYTKGHPAFVTFVSGDSPPDPTSANITSLVYYKNDELRLTVTTSALAAYFKQSLSNTFGLGDTWVLTWEARAACDHRYHQDNVYMVSSSETQAATLYTYTTRWKSYSLTFAPTLSATSIEIRFSANYGNNGGNQNAIEYRNFSLKKNGGSNLLTNPTFTNGTTGWSAVNVTGATTTLEAIKDYTYLFNGKINNIVAAPFQRAGQRTTNVQCIGQLDVFGNADLELTLQKNQTVAQIGAAAVANMAPGSYVGTSFDTGLTIVMAGDKYQKRKSKVLSVLEDLATSTAGRISEDRDGVVRICDLQFRGKQPMQTPKLTLIEGADYPYDSPGASRRSENLINKIILTADPRQTLGTGILATTQQTLTIPHLNADKTPGILKLTMNFHDSAGNPMGGDSVVTPIARTTDIQVWEFIDQTTGATSGYNYTNDPAWKESYEVRGGDVEITFENYATGNLYIPAGMNIRGNGIIMYDPTTLEKIDQSSIDTYGMVKWERRLAYYSNNNFIVSLANYYLMRYAQPYSEFTSFSVANRSTLGGVDLLTLELFDVMAVTDAQTGLSNAKHQIINIEYELSPAVDQWLASGTWQLEALENNNYLILDDATYGKLDTGKLYI